MLPIIQLVNRLRWQGRTVAAEDKPLAWVLSLTVPLYIEHRGMPAL
jgi:hypothetical protein